jgi:hypothetical protein
MALEGKAVGKVIGGRAGAIAGRRRSRKMFELGSLVTTRHGVGAIDAAYVDLQAAIDSFIIPPNWLAIQQVKPRSSPTDDFWYSVILLEGGSVLEGHDDLSAVPHVRAEVIG